MTACCTEPYSLQFLTLHLGVVATFVGYPPRSPREASRTMLPRSAIAAKLLDSFRSSFFLSCFSFLVIVRRTIVSSSYSQQESVQDIPQRLERVSFISKSERYEKSPSPRRIYRCVSVRCVLLYNVSPSLSLIYTYRL